MVYYPTRYTSTESFKPLGYRTGSFTIASTYLAKSFYTYASYLNDNQMKMIVDILNSL